MFRFQHKEYIILGLAIAVLIGLFVWLLQWKKKVTKRIGDERLVRELIADFSRPRFVLKFVLVLLAITAGILAVMNPRKAGTPEAVNRKGIDIAIALDVSKSMLATDLAPNRLERAKQFISKLMNKMPDDRIALILFAGKAYLQMPLTADHGAAQLYVSSATPDAIPQQGTVIGDALEMSAKAFTGTENRFKTVIVISDGEDHDESAVATARELSEQGVMINTIGIGSAEGTTIPDAATGDTKRDASGNPVISRLNESILQDIATATRGSYQRLESSDQAVAALDQQFAQIDQKEYTDYSQVNFKSFFMYFVAAMLLLLLVEPFIPERKKISLA